MKEKQPEWIVSSNGPYGWFREGQFFTKKEAEAFVRKLGGKHCGLIDYEIWNKKEHE